MDDDVVRGRVCVRVRHLDREAGALARRGGAVVRRLVDRQVRLGDDEVDGVARTVVLAVAALVVGRLRDAVVLADVGRVVDRVARGQGCLLYTSDAADE